MQNDAHIFLNKGN